MSIKLIAIVAAALVIPFGAMADDWKDEAGKAAGTATHRARIMAIMVMGGSATEMGIAAIGATQSQPENPRTATYPRRVNAECGIRIDRPVISRRPSAADAAFLSFQLSGAACLAA